MPEQSDIELALVQRVELLAGGGLDDLDPGKVRAAHGGGEPRTAAAVVSGVIATRAGRRGGLELAGDALGLAERLHGLAGAGQQGPAAGVSATPRGERVNSGVPISRSRSLIRAESGGWLMCSARAARPK